MRIVFDQYNTITAAGWLFHTLFFCTRETGQLFSSGKTYLTITLKDQTVCLLLYNIQCSIRIVYVSLFLNCYQSFQGTVRR